MTAFLLIGAGGFPPEFGVVEGMFDETLVFVRVVPLTKAEAMLIEREGTGALETTLRDQEADLLDLGRASVI